MSSGSKVGIFLGVGCLVVIVLMVLAGIGVYFAGSKAIEFGQEQIALEQERHQLINQWQPPPADATPDEFFPQAIGSRSRTTADDKAEIAELEIDVAGLHAVYGSGADAFDVYAYKLTPLEKEAIFGRITEAYDAEDGGMKTMVNLSYRMRFSTSQLGEYQLWYAQGWLLVFHADGDEDQETFIKDFFKASQIGTPQTVESQESETSGH